MKTVIIDGVEYELKPVEKKEANDVISDYLAGSKGSEVIEVAEQEIKDAVGVESEYRKKFVSNTLTPSDMPIVRSKAVSKPPLDGFFSGMGEHFVGEGIESYF